MSRLAVSFVLRSAAALAVLALPGTAQAAFRVLYTFTGGSDGADPAAALMMDQAGNLYGTTAGGGSGSGCEAGACGTVFKLAPDGTHTVLYSFKGGSDGADPQAGVIMDKAGNLYGTTYYGGGNSGCFGLGCGTAFKLAPDGTETILHAFAGGTGDGSTPAAGLISDQAGNLYGTTFTGGSAANCDYLVGCGTVFKLAPDGTETILYAFQGGTDGGNPSAGLIVDKAGNFYGTTVYWGADNVGTVFKLAPDGTETVLHAFNFSDGMNPYAGVIIDKAGNLYGTTSWGSFLGEVFKLAPDGTLTVLHTFSDDPDGANPYGGVVFDRSGNLYGTTSEGGRRCGNFGSSCGAVFQVAPDGTETILHRFNLEKGDGIVPYAGVIIGRNGDLFGTTTSRTWHRSGGTIFEMER